MRNSGKGVSYAHSWINVDRSSGRRSGPSATDEIKSPGGFACWFNLQWDNFVEEMRELKEARDLPRLELKFDFADRLVFSVSRDYAAVDRAFDLTSSELQKPGFACKFCQENRDELFICTAFLNQPANIWVYDPLQIGCFAANRTLRLNAPTKNFFLGYTHLEGLHAPAPDFAHSEYNATSLEREGRRIVINADKAAAARVL